MTRSRDRGVASLQAVAAATRSQRHAYIRGKSPNPYTPRDGSPRVSLSSLSRDETGYRGLSRGKLSARLAVYGAEDSAPLPPWPRQLTDSIAEIGGRNCRDVLARVDGYGGSRLNDDMQRRNVGWRQLVELPRGGSIDGEDGCPDQAHVLDHRGGAGLHNGLQAPTATPSPSDLNALVRAVLDEVADRASRHLGHAGAAGCDGEHQNAAEYCSSPHLGSIRPLKPTFVPDGTNPS